jgi:hypothetical protein
MSTRKPRTHIDALRGATRIAVDAVTGVTDLVQALHTRVARAPTRLGGPLIAGAVNGLTDLVYSSVRGVTRTVGGGLDVVLARLAPLLRAAPSDEAGSTAGTGAPKRTREALLAALNGVLGDYLAASANPLAIGMALRRGGVPLVLTPAGLSAAIEAPRARLLVLAHGLCMNDLQWERGGPAGAPHDHGAALARDLGFTPVYLHYNSGLHVSVNGQGFAAQLESLLGAWPVTVEELVIVGHSMGGLVARSAQHYGTAAGHAWPSRLRALIFLGTPHHGAPMERGGHWVDLLLQSTAYTEPFARLGRIRSAGITDLRHGSALDEDWHGRDRFAHGHDTRRPLPLPRQVNCGAIAASTGGAPAGSAGDIVEADDIGVPIDRLPGDGLVPVASALGRHDDPRLALVLAPARQCIAFNTGHLDLLSSPAVYARLRQWLAPPGGGRRRTRRS